MFESIINSKSVDDADVVLLSAAYDRTASLCADALICLEAPPGDIIVTKNRKHFELLAEILGKPLKIAESARSTVQGTPPL
jgi:hypothetical protein